MIWHADMSFPVNGHLRFREAGVAKAKEGTRVPGKAARTARAEPFNDEGTNLACICGESVNCRDGRSGGLASRGRVGEC